MPSTLSQRLRAPKEARLPGLHLGLTWRRLEVADGPGLAALVQEAERVDSPLHHIDPAEIVDLMERHHSPGRVDAIVGVDRKGVIQAAARVRVLPSAGDHALADLDAVVHPRWRNRGIGRAMLSWQEDRVRQLLLKEHGSEVEIPVRICNFVDEHATDRRRLYAAAGFSPKRSFLVMRRELVAVPDAVTPAEGYRIVPWDPKLAEDARIVHLECFADHWGIEAETTEWWAKAHRGIDQRWSFLALSPDDTVVGYVITTRRDHVWLREGRSEAYSELLGVLPGHRGNRLAKALLVSVLRAAHDSGVDYAALDVDEEHPQGAKRLYQKLGYERVGAMVYYGIDI